MTPPAPPNGRHPHASQLSAFVNGKGLSLAEWQRIVAHVNDCRQCMALVQTASTVTVIMTLPSPPTTDF